MGEGDLVGFLLIVPNTNLKCTAWVGCVGKGGLIGAFVHLKETMDVMTFSTEPVIQTEA